MPADESDRCSRRCLLRAIGTGLTALGIAGTGAAQEGDAAVLFADQTSDGVAIQLAAVRTGIDVAYVIRSQDSDRTLAEGTFNAGTRRRNVTIRLEERIERDQTLSISLSRLDDGSPLVGDTAEVTLLGEQADSDAADGSVSNETATGETSGSDATADDVVEVSEPDAVDEVSDLNERDAADEDAETDGEASADSGMPGFGVGTALASVGGLAYAFARRSGAGADE